MRRVALIPLLVACVAAPVAISVTPASANFFDMLFGRATPPPAPSYQPGPSSAPLQIRVRAKKSAHKKDPKVLRPIVVRKKERDVDHRKVAAKPAGTKVVASNDIHATQGRFELGVQKHMNPETTPDWFLKDLTLRRGDILVLRSGPVVFEGAGKTRSQEDFVSLKSSGMMSNSGRREIGMMVAGVWVPEAKASETPILRKKKRRSR